MRNDHTSCTFIFSQFSIYSKKHKDSVILQGAYRRILTIGELSLKKNVFTSLFILLFLLGLAEAIAGVGFIRASIGVDFRYLVALYVVALAFWRWLSKASIENWILVALNERVILPILLSLTLLLFGIESYQQVGYLMTAFHVNHLIFLDLSILSFLFLIISAQKNRLIQYWQLLIFIGYLLFTFYLYCYHFHIFSVLSLNASGFDDDNFMEWLQVGVLALGVAVSLQLARVTTHSMLLKTFYVLVALVFLLFIGEEISWGQRLFSISIEPSANNYQQELNIHNRAGINELTALVYYVVFVYALASWLLARWIKNRYASRMKGTTSWWVVLTFTGVGVLYFLPTALFNPYADRTILSEMPTALDLYVQFGLTPDLLKTLGFLVAWRETFEVAFYAGLVFHFVNLYLKRDKPQKSNR